MRRRAGPVPQRDRAYAHVFLPGSSFLEKDGTFTNAERRISRVRKVMRRSPAYADWEVTVGSPRRSATRCTTPPVRDHGRDRAADADLRRRVLREARALGSIQWPCNAAAPEGTPIMHVDGFVRGKGKFMITEYVPTEERTGPRFPLLLTTGRILSQYNVGAQTRRTAERRLA
jgi:formate dehydrogenase major subunit